jgi:hypothetical protein
MAMPSLFNRIVPESALLEEQHRLGTGGKHGASPTAEQYLPAGAPRRPDGAIGPVAPTTAQQQGMIACPSPPSLLCRGIQWPSIISLKLLNQFMGYRTAKLVAHAADQAAAMMIACGTFGADLALARRQQGGLLLPLGLRGVGPLGFVVAVQPETHVARVRQRC